MLEVVKRADSSFLGSIKYNFTREGYIQKAINAVNTTFAVLKEGEWYEQGKMGWFGVSSASAQDITNGKLIYGQFIDDLSDESLITIVDCHLKQINHAYIFIFNPIFSYGLMDRYFMDRPEARKRYTARINNRAHICNDIYPGRYILC